MKTKICRTCRIERPVEDFSKKRRSKDGYKLDCKPCVNARYRATHPVKEVAYSIRPRPYDVLRVQTGHGTTLVKFGDHAPRTKGLLRSAGPGLQSSMRFFDLE